jgi:hypothetical protein
MQQPKITTAERAQNDPGHRSRKLSLAQTLWLLKEPRTLAASERAGKEVHKNTYCLHKKESEHIDWADG